MVAGLFAGLLAGKTLRGMARELTERGVLSPKGRADWTHSVLKDLLESPVYTGQAYGPRYQLTARLEGVFTEELIRRPASDTKGTGLAAASA